MSHRLTTQASTPPPGLCEIYVDESSQTKHQFLLLGGLIVEAAAVDQIRSDFLDARQPELPSGELKWTKVSTAKLAAYLRLVDTFFDSKERISFHSICVDTHLFDHVMFNGGSREIGFNKEIYQLLSKFHRLYPHRLFHCYLDQRTTAASTEELRLILNRGAHKRSSVVSWPFRRIHFRPSDRDVLLQVVDVLLGGLAYRMNRHGDHEGASPAKRQLSNHILERAGIADVTRDTAITGRLTIWHRRLQGSSRNPRP